jgi:iron complex outermembrane receptor protein
MRKPSLLSGTTLALALGSGGAVAQTAAAPAAMAASAPEAPVEMIVVTGTRQSNRTLTESMSPIQVMSADSLEHSGKPGLQEALSTTLPSLTLPSQAGGNMTSIVRIATLRGLNPDHVLVLVNGKRFHSTSILNNAGSVAIGAEGVDLNMIPTAAIQRVEVLTDGAAAQYGSDAIAGVINIILKSSGSGGSASVQGGAYYDRGDGVNAEVNLDQGLKLGDDGAIHLAASTTSQALTNRAVDGTISPFYYSGDPRNSSYQQGIVYKGYGIPESSTKQIAFNAMKPVAQAVSLYAFGTVSEANGKNWVGFRAPSNDNNVLAIYPNGFEPRLIVDQKDYSLTAGAKGEALLGWDWDASFTQGGNRARMGLTDSVNPTYGDLSPTSFYLGSFHAGESTANLDLTRDFDTGWFAAPLTVAVGLEGRRDTYAITAGDVASYADGGEPVLTGPHTGLFDDVPGAQALPGFRPQDAVSASRTNEGAYIDLDTKLTKQWELGLAGRFEHYSDFGDNTSGKLSTRYELTPKVALRGTFSNGFRAPSLGQEYYTAASTAQYKGVDYITENLPVNSTAAKLLDSKPLKAERSTNLSLGLVLKPFAGATLTADAYTIALRDRIVQSAAIGLSPSGVLDPTLAALLKSQGITGIGAARYFLNGVDTRTNGLDLVGTYREEMAKFGKIDWTLASDFTRTRITGLSGLATQTLYGTQVFNQVSQDQLTKTTPKSKVILGAEWALGPWRLFGRETRYGSFTTPSTVTGGYSNEKPKYISDLELGYTLARNLEVSVGAQNVFNVYPDRTNPKNFSAATFNGAQIYNSASPFGLSGGNYYARLNYSWL